MKIAYLISAHDNPLHLKRLVDAISASNVSVFIHIDRKSNLKDFDNIQGERVHFIAHRISVYWGDFSQVEATLALIDCAVNSLDKFERFIFISGSDYPLQSRDYIENFFSKNKNKEFINIVPMLNNKAGKSIKRFTKYKPRPFKSKYYVFFIKVLVKLKLYPSVNYTKYLMDKTPYGGSSWWALTRGAIEYILSYSNNQKMITFFKGTHCPDESYFQTILGNSPYSSRILPNVTYTDWSSNSANPEKLTHKHVAYFCSQSIIEVDSVYGRAEKLFARKFDDRSTDDIASLNNAIESGKG